MNESLTYIKKGNKNTIIFTCDDDFYQTLSEYAQKSGLTKGVYARSVIYQHLNRLIKEDTL